MTDPLRAAEEALTPFAEAAIDFFTPDAPDDWVWLGRHARDTATGLSVGSLRRAASALALIRAARAEPRIIDMGTAKPDVTMFDTEVDSARAAMPQGSMALVHDGLGQVIGSVQTFTQASTGEPARAAVPADRETLATGLGFYADLSSTPNNLSALLRDAIAIIHTPAAEEVEAMAKRLDGVAAIIESVGIYNAPDTIRAAAALLRRSAAPSSEWRPIETAPKDGMPIMLSAPTWTLPATAWWSSDSGLWIFRDIGAVHDIKPTHWQPLPAAPSSAQAGDGR